MPKLKSEVGLRYLKVFKPSRDPTNAEETYLRSQDAFDCGAGWDLYFFCSDGVVAAHRLMISSVSKYIMSMFDDQPPWYPTHIHVLDLPKSIVQLLVDLAYTGEMRFPEEMQSDVIDAMHTLGWVHTDCLSADFEGEDVDLADIGKKSPMKDEIKDIPGAEAVLKMNFPVGDQNSTKKRVERASFNEEDESMEISNLPDVDLSDTEEVSKSNVEITPKKSGRKQRFTSQINDLNNDDKKNPSTSNAKAVKNSLASDKSKTIDENVKPSFFNLLEEGTKTPERRTSRKSSRRSSFSESNELDTVAKTETSDVAAKESTTDLPKKRGRKPKNTKITPILEPEICSISSTPNSTELINSVIITSHDDGSQHSCLSSTSETSSQLDSPGKRQRRKPKRFEEYDDPTEKPKSPVKNKGGDDNKNKRGKKAVAQNEPEKKSEVIDLAAAATDSSLVETSKTEPKTNPKKQVSKFAKKEAKEASNAISSDTNVITPKTPKPLVATKKRLSGGEAPRNSLITSYFNKTPRKSESDNPSSLDVDDNNSAEEAVGVPGFELIDNHNENGDEQHDLAETKKPNKKSKNTLTTKSSSSTIDDEHATEDSEPEKPLAVEINRESKKRSYDEILSNLSDAPSSEPSAQADNPDASSSRPERKSMRTPKPPKSREIDGQDDVESSKKNGEGSPKRKRTRKETLTETVGQPVPEAPTRRSSKN